MKGQRGSPKMPSGAGYTVVDRYEGRTLVYVFVAYKTAEEAEEERAGLLKFFPKGSLWRTRLCIRRPDGSIYCPDMPEAHHEQQDTYP